MFNIFLHISGIAFLEILFYFLYVGPMETKIFKETLKNALKSYHPSINNINISSNVTNFIIDNEKLDQLKIQSDEEKKEREKLNYKLFESVMIYWLISFISSLILNLIINIKIIKKYFDEGEIELANLNRNEHSNSNLNVIINRENYEDSLNNNIDNNDNEIMLITNSSENKKKKNYKYYLKFFYYFFYGGLIILFEYIFFNFIVLKYQVLSHSELLYIFYDTLIPIINSYITN